MSAAQCGDRNTVRRTETRHASARNAGGKTYHLVRKRGARAPLFVYIASCGAAAHRLCTAERSVLCRLPLSFVRTPVTRAASRFHLCARPLRELPAAFICTRARYASRLPPCAALCRAVHSPPVRSAADLLVNVVLVAVGIRLHAHVITLRRAAAAHADADDLFAAHRFALEIENTAFAAFAGSHF